MDRELVIGGFYKHFKNKLYQVKCIAYHSETKEPMVVYQTLYGDYSVYVRPMDMFMSEVDHVKYPEVKQLYRFEQVDPVSMEIVASDSVEKKMPEICNKPEETVVSGSFEQVDCEPVSEAGLSEALNQFLDAKGYESKLDVLLKNKRLYNDAMLDFMAESLEIVLPEGPVDTRIESLRKVLVAHTKYEGSHLRP